MENETSCAPQQKLYYPNGKVITVIINILIGLCSAVFPLLVVAAITIMVISFVEIVRKRHRP